MAWLSTETATLTEGWGEYLQGRVVFDDIRSVEWINLNTGGSLVLVADGGWRGAQHGTYESRYRVFFRGGQTDPVEMTSAFLRGSRNAGMFEKDRKGSDTYADVQRSCIIEIERILNDH
ncbi:hypothetical protein [Arthrobacter sp. ISL-69]|uniref:hypothetical protein n=1 Tax=Arthrobacter sp. ISL-69 TaxID=2819113 RepID=UPI001BE9887D|nr:hypothetical protein [Arthrobacter sp. ISL-69]MBT2538798.1 hypothetical protein [Arthrobacter sp. ISL-69]